MNPETAAHITRWWARFYTKGLPKAQRDARRAEIDSDLSESLSASVGSSEILSRLARGVGDDLVWSVTHMGQTARTTLWWTIGSLFTIAIVAYWLAYPSESVQSYVIASPWAWVALKASHFLAMVVFIGLRIVVDLRLLGQAYSEVEIGTVIRKLAPATVITATIAIVSGMAFYFADFPRISGSALFQVKLVLLTLALINLWYLHVIALRNFDTWEAANSRPPAAARVSAHLSMVLWAALIFVSMLVPYFFA